MENNSIKNEVKYNIGGYVIEKGKLACHDGVTVSDLNTALETVAKYLADGFAEVRINKA